MSTKTPAILFVAACLVAISGCGENTQPRSNISGTQPSAAIPEKAGAQLWAENCSRCHNIRPPQSFSDTQWQAIAHHMRLRADLTGEETRKITEFLQASH
jgi:predicted lipoprotein